jgi:hypothetical protein
MKESILERCVQPNQIQESIIFMRISDMKGNKTDYILLAIISLSALFSSRKDGLYTTSQQKGIPQARSLGEPYF